MAIVLANASGYGGGVQLLLLPLMLMHTYLQLLGESFVSAAKAAAVEASKKQKAKKRLMIAKMMMEVVVMVVMVVLVMINNTQPLTLRFHYGWMSVRR